jgi:hypothetical protein
MVSEKSSKITHQRQDQGDHEERCRALGDLPGVPGRPDINNGNNEPSINIKKDREEKSGCPDARRSETAQDD